MSLLREIQDAAVDGSSDLETLLRKCRVLATRLKHEELKNWVSWELDGYPSPDALPDYRKLRGMCYGDFFGAMGRAIKNCPIPMTDIPEKVRESLALCCLHQGVSSLKNIAESSKGPTLKFSWPAEASHFVRPENLAPDFVLAQGWVSVDTGSIVGILSTVRNKILSFALEIEASYPDSGEAKPGEQPVPKELVTQIFNQTFHGPIANVASGHGIQQTGTINIQQGDFRTLAAFMRESGVSEPDIRDLETAIRADPRPDPKSKTFGKKVSGWIRKMISKSAEGAWKVGTDAASKLLVEAVKAHYGMHP